MKLDVEKTEALLKIQKSYEAKGIFFTLEQLSNIAGSQFIIGAKAMKKGLDVRLPKWGTFKYNHKRLSKKDKHELKKLEKLLSPEEFTIRKRDIAIRQNAIETKDIIITTVKEFKAKEDIKYER
jgi:hypothetical protein